MEYWANKGYPNLVSENKKDTYMQIANSFVVTGIGIDKTKIRKGILNYCNSRGYHNFESEYYNSNNFSSNKFWYLIKNEILENRPVIACIHTFGYPFENHAVVITGIREYINIKNGKPQTIRYLTINDGSASTINSYVRFGDNSISIITFKPKKC